MKRTDGNENQDAEEDLDQWLFLPCSWKTQYLKKNTSSLQIDMWEKGNYDKNQSWIFLKNLIYRFKIYEEV